LGVSEAFAGMMVTPSVKLLRPLGAGGMGAVWVAEHLALRTEVVVKFIASGLTKNKEAQARFSREAAAASQVKSPHVVQTFDHGVTDEGVPYIVMELLEGRDLAASLDEAPSLDPELVVEIIGQLSRALDRAHEKGIIHRDIKPGNVYLCDAGRSGEIFVKLLDFGIAKGVELATNRVDSGTKTGAMIGSPFYMSPEQILGAKDIDHRSDLWSVGVLAFEMLTGHKPFDAETMGGLAIKIHSEPLPVPSSVNPDLPAAVDAWFAKACARKPAARYDSAKELAEELVHALGGQMPRSLDGAPRISTGGARLSSDAVAATLVAGAATDAGVVSGPAPSRARSRLLVLVAIVALVPPIAYVALRAVLKKDAPTALVAAEHSAGAGASVGAASGAPSVSMTVLTTAVAQGTAAPPAPPEPAPSATGAPTALRGGHGARPRVSAPPTPAAAPPTPPLPASPAVTSTTTARPATTGHDIF
jgi:serine/threonine-protein kinase